MTSVPADFLASPLGGAQGVRLTWLRGGAPLSRFGFLVLLRDDPQAAEMFGAALAAFDYPGVYWECAVIGPPTLNKDFECVLLRADHFARRASDADAFADKFATAQPGDQVVCFRSLGGSSALAAPLPIDAPEAYGHIAAFVKHARQAQISAFFAALGREALQYVHEKPVWMSTSGDAVAWLHGRLDTRPKYYQHKPYRSELQGN